jgi:hypothetical protein
LHNLKKRFSSVQINYRSQKISLFPQKKKEVIVEFWLANAPVKKIRHHLRMSKAANSSCPGGVQAMTLEAAPLFLDFTGWSGYSLCGPASLSELLLTSGAGP